MLTTGLYQVSIDGSSEHLLAIVTEAVEVLQIVLVVSSPAQRSSLSVVEDNIGRG